MLAVSCGQKQDATTHHQAELKKFESNRKQMNFAFRPNYPKPAKANPKTFAKTLCNYVEANPNPFKLEKFVSNDTSLQTITGQMQYLAQNTINCTYDKEIYDHYPLHMVSYNTNVGYKIYLHIMYDQNYKVAQTSLSLQPNELKIEHLKIPTRDNKNLSTFVFRQNDNPKGTVLIRTPYFHTGPFYLSMADNFMRLGYHVAIQSNRGSFLSQGEFRWLSNQNGEDGYDTIEYLSKQAFSNGKVVSYGVSYDGFNALASGIKNPPSLKGIIACSAPANAATDSFSSNKVTEAWLLNYVWERETNTPVEFFMQKYIYLTSTDLPRSEYDNQLFGRNVADWDDYLKDDEEYFKKRNLLPELNNIIVPTIHVAGLTNDQDGRDTILAYESLQKNAVDKDLHKLLLHESGHGCGKFGQSSEFEQYLAQSTDSPPILSGAKVRQYAQQLQTYVAGDTYPLADFTQNKMSLTGALDRFHTQLNAADFSDFPIGFFYDSNKTLAPGYQSNTFELEINDNMIINGMPQLNLHYQASAPGTTIYVDVFIQRPDGSQKTFNGVQRSAVVHEGKLDTPKQVEIKLPPTLTKLTKGSKIYIQLNTSKSWIITPNSIERDKFYEATLYGPVIIFAGTELVLPSETDQIGI